ncbi:hypothetical protein Tco_0381110 [Tanacetum coccineum]
MANLFPNDDANALVPNFNIGFVPNPGHAHFANNNNNNGWIEWDVPLGEMDEPMVDSESDEEEMDDEDDDGDVVDAPNLSIYEVGGPSTAIAAQPQVIDDLYREVDKLRDRQGALARTIVEVSDIEATNSIVMLFMKLDDYVEGDGVVVELVMVNFNDCRMKEFLSEVHDVERRGIPIDKESGSEYANPQKCIGKLLET